MKKHFFVNSPFEFFFIIYIYTYYRLISSIGLHCPDTFNPADHYIHKLSMIPGQEEEYQDRVAAICDAFEDSEHGIYTLFRRVGCSGFLKKYFFHSHRRHIRGEQRDTQQSALWRQEVKKHNLEPKFSQILIMHHCRKLKPYKAPWISQFTALLWRSWRATLQNPIIQYIKFFTYTVKQAQKQFHFLL